MKKAFVIVLCVAVCLTSFPAVALGDDPVTCTITVGDPPNGEIRIDGSVENGNAVPVTQGAEVTFAFAPAADYEIESVTIGDTVFSEDGELGDRTEFSIMLPVHEDITVTAGFRRVQHTVTTNVGANGSVDPMNPKVDHGDDVAFTITPDPGYMIDELTVDGRPETADEFGSFTIYNVQSDRTLSVTFTEFVMQSIKVEKPQHGDVQVEGEPSVVPEAGSEVLCPRGGTVSLFMYPEKPSGGFGYKLSRIVMTDDETGEEMELSGDFYYDETEQKLRVDVEARFDGTLKVEFDRELFGGSEDYLEDVAVLSAETGTEAELKNAIRRELGLRGFEVLDSQITGVGSAEAQTSLNGVAYTQTDVSVALHNTGALPLTVYAVDDATDFLLLAQQETESGFEAPEVFIVHGYAEFAWDVQAEIPGIGKGLVQGLGPYCGRILALISEDVSSRIQPWSLSEGDFLWTYQYVSAPFYRAQVHVVNKGMWSGHQLNWFPMTLIQANALCLNVEATSADGTQETFAWALDTCADLTAGDAAQAVYFGNDEITLTLPVDGIGDIAGVSTTAADTRGYTVTNTGDHTLSIAFLSDFYDTVELPLTIERQSGGSVSRTLTLLRVGVDIQTHNAQDGNPAAYRTVFHGTQYGSRVTFADGNAYKVTASYYIPDYGGDRPYGVFVTRKYADGRVETQLVTEPIANPTPSSADLFDTGNKVFVYNNGFSSWANICDYLIYAGKNPASAPVEMWVLVLKDNPSSGGTFGGVDFGSGAGVKWTKP